MSSALQKLQATPRSREVPTMRFKPLLDKPSLLVVWPRCAWTFVSHPPGPKEAVNLTDIPR